MGRHKKGTGAKPLAFYSYEADREKLAQLQKINNIKDISSMIRTLIDKAYEESCTPLALTTRINAKADEIETYKQLLQKTEAIEESKLNKYMEDYKNVEAESRPRNEIERVKAHICWIKYDPRTPHLFPGRLAEDIYTEMESRCKR